MNLRRLGKSKFGNRDLQGVQSVTSGVCGGGLTQRSVSEISKRNYGIKNGVQFGGRRGGGEGERREGYQGEKGTKVKTRAFVDAIKDSLVVNTPKIYIRSI